MALVRSRGFASVNDLAAHYGVTQQTVRRDLLLLCKAGLLQRYHGGVSIPSSVENVSYSERQSLERQAKLRIAELLARHLPDHASLFIDLGTTNDDVGRALVRHEGLHVITNNLNVALTMSKSSRIRVIVAGGMMRGADHGTTGQLPVDLIRHFKTDYAIIGTSGIDLDGTLRDFDFAEVNVAQAMIENARRTWLVADHSKIGRPALVRLAHMSMVDAWFTDQDPPEELARQLDEIGTKVHVARD